MYRTMSFDSEFGEQGVSYVELFESGSYNTSATENDSEADIGTKSYNFESQRWI